MNAAAVAASQHIENEQVILLAPAAASFDQFDSFEARGKAFCELANKHITKLQTKEPVSYKGSGRV